MPSTKKVELECPVCHCKRIVSIHMKYAVSGNCRPTIGRCRDCFKKAHRKMKDTYTVNCPDCGIERTVSYYAYKNIIREKTKGYCSECIKKYQNLIKKGNVPSNKGCNPNIKEDRRLYKLQWREKNRDKVNEYFRNYYYNNIEKGRKVRVISRAKRRATGEIDKQTIDYLEKKYINCYICGKYLDKYEIDHIHPISLGGTNDKNNLALACPSCNRRKNTKLLIEFISTIKGGYYESTP